MILLAVAYVVARAGPSADAALRQLFLLATAEWCFLSLLIAVSAFAFALPLIPVLVMGENLDISVLPRFTDSFTQSAAVVIYEGLPKPDLEADQFQAERQSKPTVSIHGFYFYKNPVAFSPADKTAIQSMIANNSLFARWGGEKLCGAYHPDFALEWRDASGEQYDALICFGCGEAKLYGARVELYCDVARPSLKALRTMLFKYHKYRPEPRQDSNT